MFCCLPFTGQAAGVNSDATNYKIFCSGCHTIDGRGSGDSRVPTFRNYVGKFLTVEGGRAFLVRVPGVATAPLNDEKMASMLNWLIKEFDPKRADLINSNPYTAEEVGPLRKDILRTSLLKYRAELTQKIDSN